MAFTVETPAGTLTINRQFEEVTNNGVLLDYQCINIGARFIGCDGETYLDRSGVMKFLDDTGWPPLAGKIGQLLTVVLPPPALSTMAAPGIEMWRLSDVIAWRAAMLAMPTPSPLTDPEALVAIRGWLARPWQSIHSAVLHDRLEEMGRETVFDLWGSGLPFSVAFYGEQFSRLLKATLREGPNRGRRARNRQKIRLARRQVALMIEMHLHYCVEGEAKGHRAENGGAERLAPDAGQQGGFYPSWPERERQPLRLFSSLEEYN